MNGQSGLRASRGWEGVGASGWQRPKGPLIRRWIGASRRRAARPIPDGRDTAPDAGAQVITLTWEQTFGRPARGEEAGGPGTDAVPAVARWRETRA